MNLDLIRPENGSTADILFSHTIHTKWLECNPYRDQILILKKLINEISMAQIIRDDKCGVCHGYIAFPVNECQLCNNRTKTFTTSSVVKTIPPQKPKNNLAKE